MADVMLVLLIIFMITAPLIASGFDAQMPNGINLIKAEEEPGDVVLGMDRDGAFYINTKPIAKADVTARLREIFTTEHTQDKILYLKAHMGLSMEKIQEAMPVLPVSFQKPPSGYSTVLMGPPIEIVIVSCRSRAETAETKPRIL